MSEEITNTRTIVIENSSGFIRVGFSGEDYPRTEIPTIVGRPKNQDIQIGTGEQNVYVGDAALNDTNNTLTLNNPIKDGIVTNLDDWTIWKQFGIIFSIMNY